MGVCSSNTNKYKRTYNQPTVSQNIKLNYADVNGSVNVERENRRDENEHIINCLKAGEVREIERILDNNQIDVNEYIFSGTDKTILHEAVISCSNPSVVNLILRYGANVNAIEKETENTALFLAALDLKEDIVRTILKFDPDIKHLNKNKQNIFEFLSHNLIQLNGVKKTALSEQEKISYDRIVEMLAEYKQMKEGEENVNE